MPTFPINPSNGDTAANKETLDRVNNNRKEIFSIVNEVIKERDIETIYHYTSSSGLEGILKSKTLWLTRWDFLNDPSEYLYIHDIIEKSLHDLPLDKNFKRIIRERNQYKKDSKLEKRPFGNTLGVYIGSFSREADSLALWQGYTKSTRTDGYCIGFDYHRIFEEQKLDLIVAPVIYFEKEQKGIIGRILLHLYKIYLSITENPNLSHETTRVVRQLFDESLVYLSVLFKHHAYQHEQELRVVYTQRSAYPYPQPEQKIRNSNGLFIPFIELPFEQKRVQSVTASPTLDPQLAVAGLNALKKSLDYNFLSQASQIPYRMI